MLTVVVAVVVVVDVEFVIGTPCGGKGGGISSLLEKICNKVYALVKLSL